MQTIDTVSLVRIAHQQAHKSVRATGPALRQSQSRHDAVMKELWRRAVEAAEDVGVEIGRRVEA